MSLDPETVWRVEEVVLTSRNKLEFLKYVPSAEHLEYMATACPEELRIPRSAWRLHPNNRAVFKPRNHVNFRQEMQAAMQMMYQAYRLPAYRTRTVMRTVALIFDDHLQGFIRVKKEAHKRLPEYAKLFPGVETGLSRIVAGFESLVAAGDMVSIELEALYAAGAAGESDPTTVPQSSIAHALRLLVAYDTALVRQLGEEEEVVVPMELTVADGQHLSPLQRAYLAM